ncbi:MAG: energy-coupling factor transporter transmembrane component T family protein [Thermodesulfobacteriota bacterium]
MDIGIIDYFANSGGSFLHRVSPLYKIISTVFVLASIVITNDFIVLLSIYLMLTALVILTRLPYLKIISIAAYPAIFAVLFAISSWNEDWTVPVSIILKALDAALAMVLLIVTTPYPGVFASLSPFLPRVIVEGLFLTYRSLFILLGLMENLLCALIIRGGISPRRYIKNITNFASGIGLLLIRGFDLSERLYGVMHMRGYSGKMAGEERKEKFSKRDILPILVGLFILGVSLGARFEESFKRYSIYLLLFSILLVFSLAFYVYFPNIIRGVFWKR